MTRMDANTEELTERPTILAWVRRGAVGILILLVAAAALVSLLGYLGRWWWPLDLLAHFRVQYFLALAVSMPLLWIAGRRRWAGLAGVLAAVNACCIAPYFFAPDCAKESDGAGLRIVSINVNFTNDRADLVLDFVNQQSPDAVVVLEYTQAWQDGLASLEAAYPYVRLQSDTALYSRRPLSDVKVTQLGGVYAPAISATIDTDAGPLSLVAAHPISPVGGWRSRLRNRQLRELATLVNEQPHPVVLVGDLNTTPWSPYFTDLLRDAKLTDARRGFGVRPSWPEPLRLSLLQIPIDHCLVGEGVCVRKFAVGSPVGSDHLPIVVDVCRRDGFRSPAADSND